MYVCLCKAVSDSEVGEAIAEGARTVDAVGSACGAGTGCGACRPMIHEMIELSGTPCSSTTGRCEDCPRPRIPVTREAA